MFVSQFNNMKIKIKSMKQYIIIALIGLMFVGCSESKDSNNHVNRYIENEVVDTIKMVTINTANILCTTFFIMTKIQFRINTNS